MSASQQETHFGRISPPDEAWLAKQPPEPILDPDLPIIDPHHHLGDRPHHRYLLDDFLADVRTGHSIVATVFEECNSMYRADGPEELRSVGGTEFVAGIAAMSASGLYGPTRVAAGMVGFADLTLGDRVEPVLEALIRAGGGRFRGVRHSAGSSGTRVVDRVSGLLASLYGDLHRTVRAKPLYVREQFPRGKDGNQLGGAVEHV